MLNKANTAQIRPHNRLFAIYFVCGVINMLFEIIREVYYPFGDVDEEQWGEPQEFADITEAVNHLKTAKGFIQNTYEFSEVDEENNTAYFTITNRGRYEGDDFIIRPFNAT